MRTFRVPAIVLAVAFVVVVPSAFGAIAISSAAGDEVMSAAPSKVCHPKKPVTCRASEFSLSAPESTIAPVADTRSEFDQAMVCMGPRWACKANTLGGTSRSEMNTQPRIESQQAMVCMGPRWACKANALTTTEPAEAEPTPEPEAAPSIETGARLESQQAMVCMGPRWACKAPTLG